MPPMTRNDLIERLMEYDWGRQLDILAYMKRFRTWAELHDDLERRETAARNVTPEKPKLLERKPMRELTDHIVPGDSANHQLLIDVLDEPGAGNANHLYRISGFNSATNLRDPWTKKHGAPATDCLRLFQNGPIAEVGVNGTTHEAELAILIDRFRGFQAGPYSCRENAVALIKLEEALMWMQRRTIARIKRGVEGTHAK
jgi:hypothetical protein